MASERQIAANRRNAQRSTGPRTAEGKARSRLNALKHGLARTLPVEALAAQEPRGDAVHDHGATLPATALAREIAGENVTDPEVLACAELIAAETLTIRRIRTRKAELFFAKPSSAPEPRPSPQRKMTLARYFRELKKQQQPLRKRDRLFPVLQLQRLDRYERRAYSRRPKALRQLDQMRDKTHPRIWQNKANWEEKYTL